MSRESALREIRLLKTKCEIESCLILGGKNSRLYVDRRDKTIERMAELYWLIWTIDKPPTP